MAVDVHPFAGRWPRLNAYWLTFALTLVSVLLAAQDADALLNRAAAAYERDQSDSARHYYRLSLANVSPAVQLRAYAGWIEVEANAADYAAADSLITLADPLLASAGLPVDVTYRYRTARATARSLDGNYRLALKDLLPLSVIDLEEVEPSRKFRALTETALVYNRMFVPDSAVHFIERAHALARGTLDTLGLRYAYFQNNLTVVYIRAERYGEAEAAARRGLRLLRTHGRENSQRMANGYDNLANVLDNQERYDEALDYRHRALELYADLGYRDDYASSLYNLGVGRFSWGDFGGAAHYVDRSLRLREALVGPGHPSLLNAYHAQSVLQSVSGNHAEAVVAFRRLLKLTKAQIGTGGEQLGRFYDGLGIAYKQLGRLDSAAHYQARALRLLEANGRGETLVAARTRYNYSGTLNEMGRLAEALRQIELSLRAYRKTGQTNSLEYSEILAAYADRLTRVGRSADAKRATEQALAIIRPGGNYRLGVEPITTLDLLTQAAFTTYQADPGAKTLRTFRSLEADFIETVERTRRQFHDPFSKGLLNRKSEASLRQLIDQYAALYRERGDPALLDRLYTLNEYAKTSLIRDRIRTVPPNFAGIPDSIPAQVTNYQRRIEKLYYASLDAGPAADSLREELFGVRRAFDGFTQALATEYPDYYQLTQLPKMWARPLVQRELQKQSKEAVVYLRGNDNYYALVLNDSAYLAECGPVADVDRAVGEWRRALASVLTTNHLATGHRLYSLLWKPIAGSLSGADVLVVPAGRLSAVPFEALSRSATTPRYLLNDFAISYTYALDLYRRQSSGKLPSQTADPVIVAPGFLATGREKGDTVMGGGATASPRSQPWSLDLARELTNRYRFDALTGAGATEADVKSALKNSSIVLFATHGRMDAGAPLRSGIRLTPGATDRSDGVLTLAEIFAGRIGADLGILGLCESGLGEPSPGDGMLSLAYAFGYAGCASTYNTLWRVDDQANAALIKHALVGMAAGQPRGIALRDAKRTYLAETNLPELRHPYYWAGLIHQGKDGPVSVSARSHWSWVWLLAVFTGVVLLISTVWWLRSARS